MKTLIDLPGNLLAEVKAVAQRRRTTLEALMEQALRQEIGFHDQPQENSLIQVNERGFPVLAKRGPGVVTSEYVYRMLDEEGG